LLEDRAAIVTGAGRDRPGHRRRARQGRRARDRQRAATRAGRGGGRRGAARSPCRATCGTPPRWSGSGPLKGRRDARAPSGRRHEASAGPRHRGV